jgi:hypothetical protein
MAGPRFPLGLVVATPGALKALEESGEAPFDFLRRHASGDWGELDVDDRRENELSLREGFRLASATSASRDLGRGRRFVPSSNLMARVRRRGGRHEIGPGD